MVRKISDNGGVYHEPPYTEEEEHELYRRMAAGPIRIAHRSDVPPQKLPQQLPEE